MAPPDPRSSTKPAPASTVDAHLGRIAEQGYSVVRDAFEPEFADAIRERLEQLERERGLGPADNVFEGRRTVRIYNLLLHGELFERIPVHERVLPIVEGVLDPGCLVSSLSSIAIDPGETAQPIHADDQLIPLPKPHVPIVCNTMWAVTDFRDENGATRVVPGSHRANHDPHPWKAFDRSIPCEMPKGSVLIYHGSLWHGGGANRSDARRIGVAMNYCAGFVRQQENQQLGIPTEQVRRFSPRLRELVGYGVYRHLIGHIDKGSPATLLDEESGGPVIWDR